MSPVELHRGESTADLLAARRPKRADGARNFDALLRAAALVFAEDGQDAALEKIATRAGLGIGTLYRNFPSREDLVEATYLAEVDDLVRLEARVADADPWEALASWLRAFDQLVTTKSGLLRAIDREAGTVLLCRDAIYGSAERLLGRAQEAGAARRDLDVGDAMMIFRGVAGVTVESERQRDRILSVAIDALRARPAPATITDRKAGGRSCRDA